MKKHIALILCSLLFAQWSVSMEYQRMITKENKWNYVQDFNGFTGKRISVATILKHANVDFEPMALMTEDWYEGLGHLTYFLGMGDELALLCFWNDGQQRYLNPTYNACVVTAYLPNALEQTTQASDFRFLPNPANEELRIESEIAFERAELYTLSGTKLLETRERTVNLRALGAGVYLLKIHLESGAIVTGKVLKW